MTSYQYNIFINGYGTPKNILTDENYELYLETIKDFLNKHPELFPDGFNLYLAGGLTNCAHMSEARAMSNWFDKNGLPNGTNNVFLVEQSTTGRENIEAMADIIDSKGYSRTIFFCETTRRCHTAFFVRNIFHSKKRDTKVIGIAFDKKSLRLKNRLFTMFIKFPILILSYYFPLVDKQIVQPARARHVKKCREEMEKQK